MTNQPTINDKVDNTKLFHKIVRDFNKKTGYNFKLPKDTDYNNKYAHPVHDDGDLVITSQIDDNVKPTYAGEDWVKEPYALNAKIDGVSFYVDDFKSYDEIKSVINNHYFKARLNTAKEVANSINALQKIMQELTDNLCVDAMKDIQKERIYDEMTRAARLVYENS
mgnify:CR=1 FL=1